MEIRIESFIDILLLVFYLFAAFSLAAGVLLHLILFRKEKHEGKHE